MRWTYEIAAAWLVSSFGIAGCGSDPAIEETWRVSNGEYTIQSARTEEGTESMLFDASAQLLAKLEYSGLRRTATLTTGSLVGNGRSGRSA